MTQYRLHYAPDNASVIVRMTLHEMEQPFETTLVDRSVQEQRGSDFRALSPTGLIPCLQTPDGPIFETGAILIWLAERHQKMAPAVGHPQRAPFLKWLFFVANTVHADMRMMFYADQYAGPDAAAQRALRGQIKSRMLDHLNLLERLTLEKPEWQAPDSPPSVLTYYIACLIRWMQLYPSDDCDWLRLSSFPALSELLHLLEMRPAVQSAALAEGLGQRPFTRPTYATPPKGTAT
jgi:glutathione S-transferase